MKMIVLLSIILCILGTFTFAQKIEKQGDKGFLITGENYSVTINNDTGLISSLAVNGKEFIEGNGVGYIPSYFMNSPEQKKANKTSLEGNKITSTADETGFVEYTFEPKKVTIKATSQSDVPMSYFIIMSNDINASVNTEKKIVKVPVVRYETGNYRWINGISAINTSGDITFWGPWNERQVIDFNLSPNESKIMTIETDSSTQTEIISAMEISSPAITFAKSGNIVIFSPKNYQVFQRSSKFNGQIYFSGKINVDCDKVFYKITGTGLNNKKYSNSWKELKYNKLNKSFEEYVDAYAGGWYKIEIKAEKDKKEVATCLIDNVGIGEVIVGAGQSNSTNCGQFPTKQKSGMVSSTDGINWQYADDPMLGCHDGTQGGSYYPHLGDKLYEVYKVPVGIASTGHGGTSIDQWNVGGELYNWMMVRIYQLGKNGFRAVLWHQGESDAFMPSEEYAIKMTALIKSSNYEVGWTFPWFVAHVSYHSPTATSHPLVRAAQKELWNTGIALQGPDTDTLGGDNRDFDGQGIHFTPKGLEAHGIMWGDFLVPYIDSCIN